MAVSQDASPSQARSIYSATVPVILPLCQFPATADALTDFST